MSALVRRPTEDAAIGRVGSPCRLCPLLIAGLRDQARRRLDRAYAHLLDHALVRALNPEVGER